MIPAPSSRRQAWAARALGLTRLSLTVLILGLGLGNALLEAGAAGSAIGLLALYALDWPSTNLRRLRPRWPLALFLGLLALAAAHTIAPSSSLYTLRHIAYKGPILVLAGLEAVRETRDLGLFAWAFTAMAFVRGLEGVFEFATHGWIAEKRVGNLMSLALPLTFCLPLFLPRAWPAWQRWLATGLAALPGLFTWAAAGARSGWIGLAAAALGFYWIRRSTRKAILAAALVLAVVLLAQPANLTPSAVTADARWEIWGVALKVWQAHPLLGAGLDAFEAGYHELGIAFDPARFDESMPHPHNIYLQFLAETGLVGLAVFLTFAWGYAALAGLRIKDALTLAAAPPRELGRSTRADVAHWFAAACFWSSFAGYLVTAVSAHSFYRTWWLSAAMTVLGLTLGACTAGSASGLRRP